MQSTQYKIPAGEESLACKVDYAEGRRDPSVICLQGGGPSGMQSTQYLATALQKHGRSVIRFDFSGQGASSGELTASSLKKRLMETEAILTYFGLKDKITVIGTSMGGAIACALTRERPVEGLVLFGPATYTPRAWEVPFGAGFSQIIREDNSFLESNIQELLHKFTGKVLYVTGSEDAVIPKGVVALYTKAISQCRESEQYIIPGCPHPIHVWALRHPKVRKIIEQKVIQLIGVTSQ